MLAPATKIVIFNIKLLGNMKQFIEVMNLVLDPAKDLEEDHLLLTNNQQSTKRPSFLQAFAQLASDSYTLSTKE